MDSDAYVDRHVDKWVYVDQTATGGSCLLKASSAWFQKYVNVPKLLVQVFLGGELKELSLEGLKENERM